MQPKIYKKQLEIGGMQPVCKVKLFVEGGRFNMKLPDNLKRIRKENNLSQEQLAEKLGVSRQAVSKWESGQSYPEMDKVLTICKLFNYNIDELMNENVKEVKENKESKNNLNKYVEDFFSYITKTITMFSNMKFTQIVKCIIEQCFIGIILFCILGLIGAIGSQVVSGLLGWLPYGAYSLAYDIIGAIYIIFALVVGVVIILHAFKIRYLDYFEIAEESDKEEKDIEDSAKDNENNKESKVSFEKSKPKIIIRDPAHSESKFLSGVTKIIMFGVKLAVGFFAFWFVLGLIALTVALVCSFMFVKTGMLFVGALICILAGIAADLVILEIAYNIIVSKKCKKTRMALQFIGSVIACGIGIGFILIGMSSFNFENYEDNSNLAETKLYIEYEDNLSIDTYYTIEYVEEDRDNIKLIANHSKYFEVNTSKTSTNTVHVYDYVKENEEFNIARDFIDSINKKQVPVYENQLKLYVYASKDNIEKMKENRQEKIKKQQQYGSRIEELEEIVSDKDDEIYELTNKIEELEEKIEEYEKAVD